MAFYLILTDEFLVRDVGGQIRVQEGTKSQAVTPAAAEVGHINILSTEKKKRRQRAKQKEKHKLHKRQSQYHTMIMSLKCP